MMWLGAALGLRWAEAAGLTVGQIDALCGTITVDRQLGRDRMLGPPKSAASKRTMAAPAWLVPARGSPARVHAATRGSAA